MKIAPFMALGVGVVASVVTAGTAGAAPTDSGVLACGGSSFVVTGFGRGTPLKLTTGTGNYVVKLARLEPSGQVVLDVRGQDGRNDLVTCTTTSPSGQAYTFQGFFTPRST